MSTDGIQQQYIPASLDGLVYVDVDGLTVNGVPVDLDNLVPYTNATKNLNLGTFNFETLGAVSAKEHVFPPFATTLMTGPTTSSIFTANAWEFSNTISTVSLGPTVTASYLTLNNITTNDTFVTFQNDGTANFANTKVRLSTMASNVYDVVNLSTLQASVAFIENVNALNYVPYNGATDNLNMGASTITTTGRINAGALRITSSLSNIDYSISVNGSDQLEFTNLTTLQTLKTDGASLFIPGNVNCYSGTVFSNDLQLSGTSFLAYGSASQWGTTLNGSGQYEIQDDAGVMRMRLSKTTGMTISTLNITQVPSATPTYALGVNGGGQVVSFAVPTATNILPLANTFTNTNIFLSTLTAGVGYTTSINGALTTNLDSLSFTSASFTTSGITGTYTAPFGTITNPSGSTYQITQTAAGRSIMAISGFTPSVGITYVFEFNIKCTIGTATISVEQDNILVSPALYPLTTGFNRVVGSFTYNGTPNTVVFKIYTGVASWNAQWDSFTLSTYSIGMNANMNALTVNNRFTQRYNALVTDVSTLVNRATMDSAISATSIVNLNNTFIGTNAFNNDVSLGVSTVVVNQQSITTSILQTSGISSQALGGTAVISGSYLLTPTPTTFPYASVYSPSQTFLANAKFNYLFTGFTSPIFGVSLTVYQANVANTGFIAISSTVPVVVGTFSGVFTPNSNPSYLGQVYFTFSGINSKTVGWTTFTYQRGMETVNGNLVVGGTATCSATGVGFIQNNGTVSVGSFADTSAGWYGTNSNHPLYFYTNNSGSRLTIASNGDITTSAGKFIATGTIANINGGSGFTVSGYMSSGSLTIGDNSKNYGGGVSTWNTNTAGLLMECLDNTEIAVHDSGARVASFMYYSGNQFTIGRDMGWGGGNVSMPGIVSITGALTFGYSRYLYSPEIAGATYGAMAVKGTGRNGWTGYSMVNDSSQQVSFMMNNTAQSHGIYNATASVWTLYSDVANGITYLQNRVGNTPISFGPGSWNTGGGGYTIISRELGNNTSALAFGTSPGRGVIISLTAGIVWNDLILSGGTIYTSCYGGINNYTNGGGWVYSSDKRVKKDIKDIKTARSLERIMALKPKTYKKIYHPDKSSTPIPQEVIEANHVGFLAQDVMETNPHCVSEWVDDNCVCDGDDGKRLGISYGDINVHMVGAIQELKKQNDAQQKEIDELREMVKALMAKLK